MGKDPVSLLGVPDGVEVMVGMVAEEIDDGVMESPPLPDPAVGPAFEAAVVVVGCWTLFSPELVLLHGFLPFFGGLPKGDVTLPVGMGAAVVERIVEEGEPVGTPPETPDVGPAVADGVGTLEEPSPPEVGDPEEAPL